MSYFKDVHISDDYNWEVENTPMGEARVAEVFRVVGTNFGGQTTLDPNFWSNAASANSGSTIVAANEIVLHPNITSANGEAVLQSVRSGRYVGGTAMRFRAQISMTAGAANNVRRWGAWDGTDGAYYKLDNTTMSACTLKNGVETAVASTSWSESTTTPTYTNCIAYEIYWTNSKVYFSISDDLKHIASFPTATWSYTCTLPIRVESKNSNAEQDDNTISVRVATIARLGAIRTEATYKHISGAATTICKYGAGTLHRITVNSPGTLCTVIDNFTGSTPVIAVIDTNKTTGGVGDYSFDCPFFTGLTIISTGVGTDLSIIYE